MMRRIGLIFATAAFALMAQPERLVDSDRNFGQAEARQKGKAGGFKAQPRQRPRGAKSRPVARPAPGRPGRPAVGRPSRPSVGRPSRPAAGRPVARPGRPAQKPAVRPSRPNTRPPAVTRPVQRPVARPPSPTRPARPARPGNRPPATAKPGRPSQLPGARPRRVGTMDCSIAPLTEPDMRTTHPALWIGPSKCQLKLGRYLRGVKFLPSGLQRYQSSCEPGNRIGPRHARTVGLVPDTPAAIRGAGGSPAARPHCQKMPEKEAGSLLLTHDDRSQPTADMGVEYTQSLDTLFRAKPEVRHPPVEVAAETRHTR